MKTSKRQYQLAMILAVATLAAGVIYGTNRLNHPRVTMHSRPADHSLAPVPVAGEPAQTNNSLTVKQSVIAGGGGQSSGGTLSTEGIIGEAVAGQASGGTLALSSGFTGGAAEIVCSFAIAPQAQTVAAIGGSGVVTVNSAAGCAWTAAGNAGWIKVTAGESGAGTGTVSYSVEANPGTAQRTGTMTIAGQTFTITQPGAPAFFAVAGAISYAIRPQPLAGVTVTASGGGIVKTESSSADGRYMLGGLTAGIYTITPTKLDGVNGITAFDAARAAQHSAGIAPLIGDQLQAADADENGVVDAADALLILKYALDKTGAGNVGQWRFTPPDRPRAVNSNLSDQDFRARLLGEVTGNWSPGNALTITAVNLPVAIRETAGNFSWTITGNGFEPGLTLVAGFPDGGEMLLRAPNVEVLTPQLLRVRAPLIGDGIWSLRLVKADGASSPAFTFKIK
ncbi:MAG TPA: BACON domain-containing carbohydrate-binding protein [Blastocatellia bacterium]|nr:BACON domain-containing carbohydrate-binding protein [Blastocatellia bacterium]HMZ18950.1 BACON domain-containing carbohydrate-binding protein [Blastocatellia bacterium]HNG33693.1 BACON domain-containing carbohydrate-binding protein [Blastocatellia bacterium]